MNTIKITEATWEKRNLGVSCLEVAVEKDDCADDVINALKDRNEQYIVVKVDAGNPEITLKLQDIGFKFIEMLFETKNDPDKRTHVPDVCKSFVKNAGYHSASDEETEAVLAEIKRGSIFTTDRIATDPHFSKELAGQRYSLWINDLLAAGKAEMLITEYSGENIGFIVMENKGKYYDPVISGLFEKYLSSGLGFVNNYCNNQYLISKNAKRSYSHISSNNFNNLKLAFLFETEIRKLTYVFVKHND